MHTNKHQKIIHVYYLHQNNSLYLKNPIKLEQDWYGAIEMVADGLIGNWSFSSAASIVDQLLPSQTIEIEPYLYFKLAFQHHQD